MSTPPRPAPAQPSRVIEPRSPPAAPAPKPSPPPGQGATPWLLTGILIAMGLLWAEVHDLRMMPRAQYEYAVEAIPDEKFTEGANRLGAEGWEIVNARRAVGDGSASYELILRRPKAPSP